MIVSIKNNHLDLITKYMLNTRSEISAIKNSKIIIIFSRGFLVICLK